MKKATIQTYFDLFLIASVLGYLWEVLIYLVWYHSLVNRGFFHGPWLPIYGVGAVFLELFLKSFPSLYQNRHAGPSVPGSASAVLVRCLRAVFLFLGSAFFCSCLEYLLGIYLTWRRGMRYWDYRAFPLNLDGYVCLYSFLSFGIAGILLHDVLFPYLSKNSATASRTLFMRIPRLVLLLLFALDVLYSCHTPNTGDNITFSVWQSFRIR